MNEDKTQGSFVTGFALGIFAGGLGYYLFATEKGKKLAKIAQKEWKEAMEHMETDSHGSPLPKTLREFVDIVLKPVDKKVDDSSAHKKPNRKRSPASTNDRFRGV